MNVPIENALLQDLTDVLNRLNEAEDAARDADVAARRQREVVAQLDEQARRLRLALFALEGKAIDAGEANKLNLRQRQEIRKA